MDDRVLARIEMTGGPARVTFGDNGSSSGPLGVLGVDVAARTVDEISYTVVQVLFDDDRPGFDLRLLDSPLVADLLDGTGEVLVREPFDHEQFRRQLLAERQAGESVRRGVLVLDGGEPPPPWIRLAFLPLPLDRTAGSVLEVRRTSVAELRAGVEHAFSDGHIGEDERRALLTTIEQRHPEGAE